MANAIGKSRLSPAARLRIACAVGVYLLLGLATTVAIAWGGAIARQMVNENHADEFVSLTWLATTTSSELEVISQKPDNGSDYEWRSLLSQDFSPVIPRWSALNIPPHARDAFARELGAGWPLTCLRQIYLSNPEGRGRPPRLYAQPLGAIRGVLPMHDVESRWNSVYGLPVAIVPFGLIADILFWSLAWYVSLVIIPRIVRLNLWLRRTPQGRCPDCGYIASKSNSRRCPECGTVVSARPRVFVNPPILRAVFPLIVLLCLTSAAAALIRGYDPIKPIHRAAIDGDVDALRNLLAGGIPADLNVKSGGHASFTPLAFAVMNGDIEAARVLLESGADVNNWATSGVSPALCYAAARGDIQMCRFLLKSEPDLDLQDGSGMTPLLIAVDANHSDVAHLLLEAGADPNIGAPRFGLSPLHAATTPEMLQDLLDHGADPTVTYARGTALVHQLNHGRTQCAELLLDHGAIIDPWLVRVTFRTGNGAAVDTLLDLAIEHGVRFDRVEADQLISPANQRGRYRPNDTMLAELMQDYQHWRRDLLTADRIEKLIILGADVNARLRFVSWIGSSGQQLLTTHTPLMITAMSNRPDLAEVLLRHGADPVETVDGKTVADYANPELLDLVNQHRRKQREANPADEPANERDRDGEG